MRYLTGRGLSVCLCQGDVLCLPAYWLHEVVAEGEEQNEGSRGEGTGAAAEAAGNSAAGGGGGGGRGGAGGGASISFNSFLPSEAQGAIFQHSEFFFVAVSERAFPGHIYVHLYCISPPSL